MQKAQRGAAAKNELRRFPRFDPSREVAIDRDSQPPSPPLRIARLIRGPTVKRQRPVHRGPYAVVRSLVWSGLVFTSLSLARIPAPYDSKVRSDNPIWPRRQDETPHHVARPHTTYLAVTCFSRARTLSPHVPSSTSLFIPREDDRPRAFILSESTGFPAERSEPRRP